VAAAAAAAAADTGAGTAWSESGGAGTRAEAAAADDDAGLATEVAARAEGGPALPDRPSAPCRSAFLNKSPGNA
jgi:hypothetical protein